MSESATARRRRTIDAFIDLVLEHDRHPRPEDVAERADVSIATLYRYFANLDELRRDAVHRLVERYPELFEIESLGHGTRHERIDRFAVARVDLHEFTHPLQRLSRSMSRTDTSAGEHLDAMRSVMADQVRKQFGQELAPLPGQRRNDVVDAIAVLTSVESWEQFRESYGRTPEETKRAWTSAIDAVLPET